MEGRATAAPEQIVESSRDDPLPVLAVDRLGEFGAAFRFAVFARGEWYADAIYARRWDGGWEEMGSGGSRGDGWVAPWVPPAEGWEGEALYVMGSGGLDVEDEHGSDAELCVVYGFAAPQVATVEVAGPNCDRAVPVSSNVGAFAILLVGTGEFTLTPRTGDGEPCASERRFSLRPYGA